MCASRTSLMEWIKYRYPFARFYRTASTSFYSIRRVRFSFLFWSGLRKNIFIRTESSNSGVHRRLDLKIVIRFREVGADNSEGKSCRGRNLINFHSKGNNTNTFEQLDFSKSLVFFLNIHDALCSCELPRVVSKLINIPTGDLIKQVRQPWRNRNLANCTEFHTGLELDGLVRWLCFRCSMTTRSSLPYPLLCIS